MKKIYKTCSLTLVALLFCALTGILMAEPVRHLVRPGETLYSISRRYGVTVEAIQAANPAIEGTNIPSGMMLTIPDATSAEAASPTAQPADAPVPQPAAAPAAESETEASHWQDGVQTLAVFMPFNLDGNTADELKAQMRSLEYYQGLLMAVDEMQQKGRRIEVQTYDCGSTPLQQLLASPDLKRADVLLAPMAENEVEQVAAWGEANGVPVISPFVYSASMQQRYSQLLQVNTPKAQLYPQLTADLKKRFAGYTFVFITDSLGAVKPDPYAALLKRELQASGFDCRSLSFRSPDRLMACDSVLNLREAPVMFVPVTPSKENMRRIFSGLQHVKILRDARFAEAVERPHEGEIQQPQMAMLGYPEWAMWTNDFIDYYYDLNVYMFSKIYVNPFDEKVAQFFTNFKYWYGKDLMPLVLRYGLLGYDVAHFALQSLADHGHRMVTELDGRPAQTLQTMLCFEHDAETQRATNRGLYLIHFTQFSGIEKIQVVP